MPRKPCSLSVIVSSLTLTLSLTSTEIRAEDGKPISFGVELKGNYRDSDQNKFPIPFPFPPSFLPVGETRASLETVDSGSHFEISRITLLLEGQFSPLFQGRIKVDTIDRYDRNPTSSDNEIDVDEIWLRYGTELPPEELAAGSSLYVKLGKFGKFERQDDRNLESYGLVSTTFNRFEDAGLEIGVDIGNHFYIKGSYTTGNPLFFRDPNALAGDNGTPERNPFENPNPDPDLKSGFVMFYDTEIEDWDFGSNAETGLALGLRLGAGYTRTANLMVFHYERELADGVDLRGTFYSGDLDTLRGVEEELGFAGGLPLQGRDKEETGANLWLYLGSFTFFGQYVDAEFAGLGYEGIEGEAAYSFDLPISWAIAGKPLFSTITPAIRFSKINPDFVGNGNRYPTPSVWWDWEKLDIGFHLRLYQDLGLMVEHNSLKFLRGGRWEHNDEFLATLGYRWSKP